MEAGAIVQLVVSGGEVAVPQLGGLRQQEAAGLLTKSGLGVGALSTIEMSDPAQQGRVASQYPWRGTGDGRHAGGSGDLYPG